MIPKTFLICSSVSVIKFPYKHKILIVINCSDRVHDPGGGVTTIYEGTGYAIFWGAFFPAENKFWGTIFGKITSSHKFWGVILEK